MQVELWTFIRPGKINASKQYLYKFIGIMGRKRTIFLDNDFDSLLAVKGNDLDLHNSHRTQKIPNFATNNIKIWFFTHQTYSD